MSDRLRIFLTGIGLAEHYEALAAEQVEPEDLPLLSDADLAGLGLPLGPRRRLQRAAQSAGGDIVPPPVQERRNLTVLFCDMVDSTSVASRLDPEDLRIRFRAFKETCEAVIEAEDGFVAHRLGDGLMAHFGLPNALEDAALCAVRAGLEIVARVARLDSPGGAMSVRVGIASGLTVIEEARSGIVEKDEVATGATLALAARLQALARPGEVLVSDATRALLRNAVILKPLGPQALKGFPEREHVWQVNGLVDDRSTLGDASSPGALLGRDAERDALLDLWREARAGRGGAVLITGEPGIGKSRLASEMRRAASDEGEVIALHCYRHRHGAVLHPVTDWIDAMAGRGTGLTDLRGVTEESAGLLSRIMGQSSGEKDDTDPVQLQAAILGAVIGLLAPEPGRPRIVLVEDLHWADPLTLDVLDRLGEMAPALPFMVVATTRPGVGRLPAEFHRIVLPPLAKDATDALISAQAGSAVLPPAVRRTIAERSGGVPFFAEELTRAVLDTPGAEMVSVPYTLQDTLMSRLDRLGAGKSVAQIGALLGPSFSHALLAACSDLPDALIADGIAELVAANLVEPSEGSADGFGFRHGLVRDVAYGSLLRSRRAELHRRVARSLCEQFPAEAEAQPERVAHHFTEAEDFAAAVPFWERAAEMAVAKAAPASAIYYFHKALDFLARQPASAERDQHEATLRIRLNMPLTVTTGFASAETEENLSRMADLFEVLEPGEPALQLLWSRSMSGLVRSDLLSARTTALRLARVAERARLPNAVRMPDRMLGYIAMIEGDLDHAEACFARVLDGYEPADFDPILPGHPFDVLASTLAQRAILRALRDDAAAVAADQELALGRIARFDSPATSFQVLVHLCLARLELGDFDGVMPLLAKLRVLVDRNEIAPLYVEIWEGWARARAGALDEGLAAMTRALQNEQQYPLWMPGATLLQVQLLAEAGRFGEALTHLDSCDADIVRYGHGYLLAEARRWRAVCLAATGAPEDVTTRLLKEAVATASQQGARLFERRARQVLEARHGEAGKDLEHDGMRHG